MPTGHYERPPIVADRLRWLAPHADGFKTSLGLQGYSAPTIVEVLRLLSRWAEWAQAAGFGFIDIEAALAASSTVFRGGKTARAPQGAAELFVAHLRVVGILPAEHVRSPEEIWPMLAAYRRWMREQRGVAASTLDLHQGVLVGLVEKLGDDPAAYTAAAVRAFVLERARPHGRGRAQAIASATRSFLRFLIAVGQCPPGRDHAVPGFASWQLASTPRFLRAPDLERVIAACEQQEGMRLHHHRSASRA